MISYMDKDGNVAHIVKHYQKANTVEYTLNDSKESEYATWQAFIRRFNSIKRGK